MDSEERNCYEVDRSRHMIDFRLAPYPLGVCAAVAMLAGCGGRAGNGVVPSNAIPNSFPYHKSFYYTGAAQDFKVPAGVRQVKVIARGAHGAHSVASPEAYGGRVHAVIPVTPGEHLVVYVGGDAPGATGGFNGGSSGGSSTYSGQDGYGGGGASDVREGGDALSDRIVVAGGAGGEGGLAGGSGGAGGTTCVGSYGNAGDNGAIGAGGSGGSGSPSGHSYVAGGGGGGGGFYGGGGGGAGCSSYSSYVSDGGGGGGGSGYAESRATDVQMWQGWKQSARNGLVVFSW
jgi:hypothetical protein